MIEYTGDPNKASGTISQEGEEVYFTLYCDACGRMDGDEGIHVERHTEEEGFAEGDYCRACADEMRAQGKTGEDLSILIPKPGPMENAIRLRNALNTAKLIRDAEGLSLDGFWTYENEFFCWPYLSWLTDNDIIILNERMGETPELDLTGLDDEEDELNVRFRSIAAKYAVKPWYYLNRGGLFDGALATDEERREIRTRLRRTTAILDGSSGRHMVHADNFGLYHHEFLAPLGGSFHERTFTLLEMCSLRDFIETVRPRGVMLTYVTSDPRCHALEVDLGPLVDMCDIPELQYLKLTFVTDAHEFQKATEHTGFNGTVEFVLGYVV